MKDLRKLDEILQKHRIREYGICGFQTITHFLPCRNVVRIPSEAKSVIVCAFPYYTDEPEFTNLCCYARVPDYHVVVGNLLREAGEELSDEFGGQFEAFVDVSPLPEQECAVQAGLGFFGKNGLVIHPKYGTYFVIGELVTDLEFPLSQSNNGHCLGCGRCIQNCPSGALRESGFDAQICLSAVTQRKGELTAKEEQLIQQGGLVWGCDQCQKVCPHNAQVQPTYLPEFYLYQEPVVTIENLAALRKTRAFGYRGRALMERNLKLFETYLAQQTDKGEKNRKL